MSMTTMLILIVIIVAAFLIMKVLSQEQEQSPLIKLLKEAGVRPGETEQLMSGSTVWRRRGQLMTDRETHFFHGLLRDVDAGRWYLCPQVRVADIVQISSAVRPRSKTWWKLFNLVSRWHCDVVIVDRATLDVVAAVELDDRSHLKSSRRRRNILLNEVMRQAGIPLLRGYDREELQEQILRFLASRDKDSAAEPSDKGGADIYCRPAVGGT